MEKVCEEGKKMMKKHMSKINKQYLFFFVVDLLIGIVVGHVYCWLYAVADLTMILDILLFAAIVVISMHVHGVKSYRKFEKIILPMVLLLISIFVSIVSCLIFHHSLWEHNIIEGVWLLLEVHICMLVVPHFISAVLTKLILFVYRKIVRRKQVASESNAETQANRDGSEL